MYISNNLKILLLILIYKQIELLSNVPLYFQHIFKTNLLHLFLFRFVRPIKTRRSFAQRDPSGRMYFSFIYEIHRTRCRESPTSIHLFKRPENIHEHGRIVARRLHKPSLSAHENSPFNSRFVSKKERNFIGQTESIAVPPPVKKAEPSFVLSYSP